MPLAWNSIFCADQLKMYSISRSVKLYHEWITELKRLSIGPQIKSVHRGFRD